LLGQNRVRVDRLTTAPSSRDSHLGNTKVKVVVAGSSIPGITHKTNKLTTAKCLSFRYAIGVAQQMTIIIDVRSRRVRLTEHYSAAAGLMKFQHFSIVCGQHSRVAWRHYVQCSVRSTVGARILKRIAQLSWSYTRHRY